MSSTSKGPPPPLTRALVSRFDGIWAKLPEDVPLDVVLNEIRSGRHRETIENLRRLSADEYARQKKSLPAFTTSGTCSDRKSPLVHSGLLQVDLDDLGQDRLSDLRQRLKADPYVCFYFVSPSGSGLKVGVHIDGERHAESFAAAQTYFRTNYEVEVDAHVKDLLRLCFVSHDPELFMRWCPAVLPLLKSETFSDLAEEPRQTFLGEPPRRTSLGGPPKRDSVGAVPIGGCLCNYDGGVEVGVSGDVETSAARQQIEQAVQEAERSTRPKKNNRGAFLAVVTLIRIRDVDDVKAMPSAERSYFAEQWYQTLKAAGRITQGKTKAHYYTDIFSAIKNAKRKDGMSGNPLDEAWRLAQTEPLPPEASKFDDEPRLQRLIALCYQMHLSHDRGNWFLARDRTGKMMGLSQTDTRHWLGESLKVLEGCGVLEIVTPFDKAKGRATEYRYIEGGPKSE